MVFVKSILQPAASAADKVPKKKKAPDSAAMICVLNFT